MKKTRRKLVLAALPLASAAATAPAWAQFGGLLGGNKSSGGGNIDGDISNFLGKSFNIEMSASKAYLAIAAAFASETERAKFQAMFDDVGKQTNPQEAGAKFQQVRETTEAEIKRISEEKDLDAKTKSLSADKQKNLARGVGNILLAGFQAKDLVPTGQGIVSGVGANPMAVSKLPPVKDAITRLQGAISMAGSAMPKLLKALQGANVSVATASASSKEEPISAI
jgi:hypothetical protein